MNTTPSDKAADFTLQNSKDQSISLSDFRGKWVILYFYPKDNTSGCTREAIDFTALLPSFSEREAVVIGVSPDSSKSHGDFITRHNLRIELLSDPDHTVIGAYGVWRKKKNYGREYYGVVRTTFLIDPKGTIVQKWENVKVDGHADVVLQSLCTVQQ